MAKPLMWGIGCLDCHQVQVPWWCSWQLFNRNWLMCWSWGILSGRLYYYHILLQVLMALRPMYRFMCLMYPSPATLVTLIYISFWIDQMNRNKLFTLQYIGRGIPGYTCLLFLSFIHVWISMPTLISPIIAKESEASWRIPGKCGSNKKDCLWVRQWKFYPAKRWIQGS